MVDAGLNDRATLSRRGVLGRAEVARLATQDASRALSVARAIAHPWYRCQALSSVVERNPSIRDADAILEEALESAYAQLEPNRVASAAYWPLRLLVGSNEERAAHHLRKLLQVIAREDHGLRRLNGLHAVLSSVVAIPALRSVALVPLLATASACEGWRTERLLNETALILSAHDRRSAAELLHSRPETRYNREARVFLHGGPRAGT